MQFCRSPSIRSQTRCLLVHDLVASEMPALVFFLFSVYLPAFIPIQAPTLPPFCTDFLTKPLAFKSPCWCINTSFPCLIYQLKQLMLADIPRDKSAFPPPPTSSSKELQIAGNTELCKQPQASSICSQSCKRGGIHSSLVWHSGSYVGEATRQCSSTYLVCRSSQLQSLAPPDEGSQVNGDVKYFHLRP